MSYAATQKQHHIHVPWMTVVAVGLAVVAAAAVLILVNRPDDPDRDRAGPGRAQATVAVAAVPSPRPWPSASISPGGRDAVSQAEQFAYPRNHVIGATLAPMSAAVLVGSREPQAAPNDPHPLNHFPAEP